MKRSEAWQLKGEWRIIEMPTWPADHLDLIGPAYIEFDGSGHGELAFGALTATLDCSTTPGGIDFEWHGYDEMDEVTGDGWVELQADGSLIGEFAYDNGDETTLRARMWGFFNSLLERFSFFMEAMTEGALIRALALAKLKLRFGVAMSPTPGQARGRLPSFGRAKAIITDSFALSRASRSQCEAGWERVRGTRG